MYVSTADEQLEAARDYAGNELPQTTGGTSLICGGPIDSSQSHMLRNVPNSS